MGPLRGIPLLWAVLVPLHTRPELTIEIMMQSDAPLQAALQNGIMRELAQSGVFGERTVVWVDARQAVPGREYPGLVMVKFHGACRLPDPSKRAKDFTGTLGWVEKVDGQILSIIHVDCPRIGEALASSLDPTCANEVYARAIARVIRHEWHHVQLNSSAHEKTGENKRALRVEELAEPLGLHH